MSVEDRNKCLGLCRHAVLVLFHEWSRNMLFAARVAVGPILASGLTTSSTVV
jgi:hypothetical protein